MPVQRSGHGTSPRARRVLGAVVATVMVAAGLLAASGQAAVSAPRQNAPANLQYRAVSLSWKQADGPKVIDFTLAATLNCAEVSPSCDLEPGDTFDAGLDLNPGNGMPVPYPPLVVVSSDAAGNRLTAVGHLRYDYKGSPARLASLPVCCLLNRVGDGHINNPGGTTLTITLKRQVTASGPVADAPAEVVCAADAVCTFQVPATTDDGAQLKWILAKPGEGSSFTQPPGAKINAATGVYTWDTHLQTRYPSGPTYYSTAVVVQKIVAGKVASSTWTTFLLKIPAGPATNTRPTWTSGPGANEVIQSAVGLPVRLHLSAYDADPGDVVTLAAPGRPAGSTFATAPHEEAASADFSWTPTTPGDYPLTFTAVDSRGGSTVAPLTPTVHVIPATVAADGIVNQPGGRRLATTFSIAADDSNANAPGGTLSGLARVKAPHADFSSTTLNSLVRHGSTSIATLTGTCVSGLPCRMVATMTDGSPDSIKIVIKRTDTGAQMFFINNVLTSGDVLFP